MLDRVVAFLESRPNVWIDGVAFENVGGLYAWRSRLSDARTKRGLTIENRQRRVTRDDGTSFTISEYRYVKDARSASDSEPSLKSATAVSAVDPNGAIRGNADHAREGLLF